jgi:tetratricopeptide (TPR) repeat protein
VRIYAAIDSGLRGDFYMAAGEYEKAAKDYEDAIARLDPSCRDFEFKCGHARLKAGDGDSAIRHFSKILSASDKLTKKDHPDYEKERAYNGVAQVHLRQNKPELAIQDCTAAILLNRQPNTGESHYWRAKAYRALGKNDLARIDEQLSVGREFIPHEFVL